MIKSRISAPIVALTIAATMPVAEMDAELRQQPAPDEGADDSDDEIADDPEPGALHDLTRKPSGNQADKQDDEKAFARHVHAYRSDPEDKSSPQGLARSATKSRVACEYPTALRLCQGGNCAKLLTSNGRDEKSAATI